MGPFPTAASHSVQVSPNPSLPHFQGETVDFSLQIILTVNLKKLYLTRTTQYDALGAARVTSPGARAVNTKVVAELLRLVSMQITSLQKLFIDISVGRDNLLRGLLRMLTDWPAMAEAFQKSRPATGRRMNRMVKNWSRHRKTSVMGNRAGRVVKLGDEERFTFEEVV